MHESTRSIVFVASGVAVAALLVGIAVSVISRDWVPAVASFVVALVCLLVALMIRRKALPSVVRASSSETVVDVPTIGEVRIQVDPD